MSQIFELRLAPETLTADAQLLGVTPAQLQHIKVKVSATVIQRPESQLWLSYHIQLPDAGLAAQLSWSAWNPAQVDFTDYLWEQTCLECFISGSATDTNESAGYIEINASPNGNYALYQFDGYRHPSTLPPTPLLTADGNRRTHISWADTLAKPQIKPTTTTTTTTTTLSPAPKPTIITANLMTATFTARYCYQRSFGLSLKQLPAVIFQNGTSNKSGTTNKSYSIESSQHKGSANNTGIERLHPCVILWFGEVALYFAPTHASPADFHQRQYWPRFNYQTALNQ